MVSGGGTRASLDAHHLIVNLANSITNQTGWKVSESVNILCPEDLNYNLCMSTCGSLGLNNTIEYLDTYCLPKLPPGQPLLITRDKRYGTASGKVTYHGSALDDIYHTDLGFLWGIEFLEPVDLSHWDKITKATLYIDNPPKAPQWNRNVIAQSPIYIYRANVMGPHFRNQMGSGDDMPGYKDRKINIIIRPPFVENVIVSQLNLDHPDYKAMSWDAVDQAYKSLNLTKWLRWTGENVGSLGQGIVLRQPSLEDFSGTDRSEKTIMGSDALMYLDVREEQWVVAAPHCSSFMSCENCRGIEGCHWCMISSRKNICTLGCDEIWIVDDLCKSESSTSMTRKPRGSDTTFTSTTIDSTGSFERITSERS